MCTRMTHTSRRTRTIVADGIRRCYGLEEGKPGINSVPQGTPAKSAGKQNTFTRLRFGIYKLFILQTTAPVNHRLGWADFI